MNKEEQIQKLAEAISAFTVLGHVSSKTLAIDLIEAGYVKLALSPPEKKRAEFKTAFADEFTPTPQPDNEIDISVPMPPKKEYSVTLKIIPESSDEQEAKAIDCKNECASYERCKPFVNPISCTSPEHKPIPESLEQLRDKIAEFIYQHCNDCNPDLGREFLYPICQQESSFIIQLIQPLLDAKDADLKDMKESNDYYEEGIAMLQEQIKELETEHKNYVNDYNLKVQQVAKLQADLESVKKTGEEWVEKYKADLSQANAREENDKEIISQYAKITESLKADLEAKDKEIRELRQLLWGTHPCEGKYGDDGELQCNNLNCMIDFKRDSTGTIYQKLLKRGLNLLNK